MVGQAEQYKAEDEAPSMTAKNSQEAYVFQERAPLEMKAQEGKIPKEGRLQVQRQVSGSPRLAEPSQP